MPEKFGVTWIGLTAYLMMRCEDPKPKIKYTHQDGRTFWFESEIKFSDWEFEYTCTAERRHDQLVCSLRNRVSRNKSPQDASNSNKGYIPFNKSENT